MSQGDHERPLNKRGKASAPFMGQKLKEKGEQIEVFYSSTAKRALTTAVHIGEALGISPEEIHQKSEIYHAGRMGILEVINGVNDKFVSAAIFGHNPGFTDMANYLTGEWIDNIPTCGIVKIEFDVDTWEAVSGGNGRMVWFDYPKRYPEMQGL